MNRNILAVVAVGLILAIGVCGASAKNDDSTSRRTAMPLFDSPPAPAVTNGARLETLWIFEADYEDLTGNNAGWQGFDRSGIIASDNFWHHDTIRLDGHTELGDSTWWCGTYSVCWRQPRGYANDWLQILERHFTEATSAITGDAVTLEFDHRFAMEKDYDYGYVDVRSTATSDTWYTVQTYTNFGFAGTPGMPTQWGAAATPDQTIDLSAYALSGGSGVEFDVRFRFESDPAYSCQDQFNNTANSVKDGAWQLDNLTLALNGTPVYSDDSESYGDNGWIHDDITASGQTGVGFWRGQFGVDFITGRSFTCDDRPVGTWMWAAVDVGTSKMVDDQVSWLMSPPIDVSGAAKLVGNWDFWLDMPRNSEDICNLNLASNDLYECVTDPAGFVDEDPGWWYGDAGWRTRYDDWDAFAGNDWLATLWIEMNDGVSAGHWAGIIMNRQRVGIPSGDAGTAFEVDTWNSFNDWFGEELTDAMLDTMYLTVKDDDGVASVTLHASNTGGASWSQYSGYVESEGSNTWHLPPPSAEMTVGSEIWYYVEAVDLEGNHAVYPSDAPDHYFEMSILPLNATTVDPGLLLVDKHGRVTPGETRHRGGYPITRPLIEHHSEYYYVEMLEILGYEYEVYDVEVPSGSTDQSDGPDTTGMKYYDTQIWFVNTFNAYTVKPPDQERLIYWLNESALGKERNLLITGNDVAYELMDVGKESLNFFTQWLSCDYQANQVGAVTVDSVPTLKEHTGGFTFMDYDDGSCIVRGGCPVINYFDVIGIAPGSEANAQVVADYVKLDASELPAGVAYTHPTSGYKTVMLGFGMEFMMDSLLPSGYYASGVEDRVNLMGNILGTTGSTGYFGLTPGGTATGVVDGSKNELSHAYPNPFNPVTKIAYSVKEAGPVTIQVYNVAGKVVRTLLDTEVEAGTSGYVVWDGTGESGQKCASGVYFYRIAAPGFSTSRKMIMLK
jgi:hypothetical protein